MKHHLFILLTISVLCAPLITHAAPAIPEPLVFDMMRPLTAKQGEMEVNSLFQQPLGGDKTLEWAPELEYAFADGYAIEFELPMENSQLSAYKIGLQGSFGTAFNDQLIHGWQYVGVYERDSSAISNSLLYMAGYRTGQWSTMQMVGFEHTDLRARGATHTLWNPSVFYDVSEHATGGIEFNMKMGQQHSLLIMPQWHQALSENINLQLGVGMVTATAEKSHGLAAFRFIREL